MPTDSEPMDRDETPLSAGKQMRGRLERLEGRMIVGWLFDPARSDERLYVEILINGSVSTVGVADVIRGDLKRAGIGDGKHGFKLEIPESEFDGTTKSLIAREARTHAVLPAEQVNFVFDQRLGMDLIGETIGFVGSKMVGYVYNRANQEDVFAIKIARDGGEPTRVGIANEATPLVAPNTTLPKRRGFSVDVSADDLVLLANGTLQITASPGEIDVTPSAKIIQELATLEVGLNEDDLASARVVISPNCAIPLLLEVLINGNIFSCIEWHPGMRHRVLPLYIDRNSNINSKISTRFANTLVEIKSSPQLLGQGISRDLIENGNFESWDGPTPSYWIIETPNNVRAVKVHSNLKPLRQGLISNEAVRFTSTVEGAKITGSYLSQNFNYEQLTGQTVVNVVLAATAAHPTQLKFRMEVLPRDHEKSNADEASIIISEKIVTIDSMLRLQMLNIALPQDDKHGFVTVTLSIESDPCEYFELVFIALGAPGFKVNRSTVNAKDNVRDKHENAIQNGKMEQWLPPFVRNVDQRRIVAAEGWSISAKQACPAVETRLVSVLIRDIQSGSSGQLGYGLALSGPVVGDYLRLETVLDPFVIAQEKTLKLQFFAQLPNGIKNVSKLTASQISEIFVIRRERDSQKGDTEVYHDRKLVSLARNIPMGTTGMIHHYPLSLNNLKGLKEYSEKVLYDPYHQIILCFEFKVQIECILTDVYFGSMESIVKPSLPSYFDFEDPRISAQLRLLKSFESWTDPRFVRSVVRLAGQNEVVRWKWSKSACSVDVVIPVYNAIDDTIACLKSLERHTTIPHRIVLIDDSSERHVGEQLDRFAKSRPWVQVVRNKINQGYTKSANIGMVNSSSEWIVLLNSDTIVGPDWLTGLFEVVHERPNVAMVGPVSNAASWQSVPDLYDVNGKWRVNALPEGVSVDAMATIVASISTHSYPSVPLLNGFCTLIRRSALDEVGYLDEIAFPVGYGEENDLCVRIKNAGYDLAIADHVYVYHRKSASFGTKRRDELSRKGTESFRNKHPEVDLRELQQQYSEISALVELRKLLRNRLADTFAICEEREVSDYQS